MEETGYRISSRQLQRMIILETGSIGCLFVAAWSGGRNGILTVMLSIIGSIVYGGILMLIGRTDGGYFAMTERSLHGFLWRLVWLVYIIRFAIRGAWILSYLDYLIRETLYDGSRLMVIIPLLLVCAYAGFRNLEGRARFTELLFWWIMIPLVLLFFIGLWKADFRILLPEEELHIRQLLKDEYRMMALFLPLEFILFRMSAIEGGNQKAWYAGMRGILLSGLWLLLVYIVTAGMLGTDWSSNSLLGVTEAMELISMKGGGLERLDILMILFWLIGGIITLSAYIFQGQQLLRRMLPGRRGAGLSSVCMTLLVLALYFIFPDADAWSEWYLQYACRIDLPVSLALPVIIWCIYKLRSRKERKTMWKTSLEKPVKEFSCLFIAFALAMSLTGCRSQVSIEDRTYVESIHIAPYGDSYQFRCTLAYMDAQSMENLKMSLEGAVETEADTQAVTEENTKTENESEKRSMDANVEEEGQSQGAGQEYTAIAEDIETFNQDYYRITGSRFDYSHLEGIYLDSRLYQPEQAEDVLEDIREETQAVLSTPVYQEGVATGNQKEETLGDWLRETREN